MSNPVFEKVVQAPDTSFACERFSGNAFECPYHQHPEIEILHIEKSSGRTVIGDFSGTFSPGHIYLFAPNVPHLFHNDAMMRPRSSRAQSRFIHFLPNFMGQQVWQLPEMQTISRLLIRGRRGILWNGPPAQRVVHLVDEVFAAQGPARIAHLVDLLGFLSTSRSGRLLASTSYAPNNDHTNSERLNRALAYVHTRLHEKIEVAEAARRVGISLSGFGRFFRRHMGRSFVNYVIDQRLAEARRLLMESDLNVSEICFRCGFENLSNFNRHFRARMKQTPSAFRFSLPF